MTQRKTTKAPLNTEGSLVCSSAAEHLTFIAASGQTRKGSR